LDARAVSVPGGDAASQDALDGAAVELFEDTRAHDKSFKSTQSDTGEELTKNVISPWARGQSEL
jgi:hypothetical protein